MNAGSKRERALMLDRVGYRRLRPALELARTIEHTSAGVLLVAKPRRRR